MTNDEILEMEKQILQIEDAIPKIKELLTDVRACTSETARTILAAAIRKYAAVLTEFKI